MRGGLHTGRKGWWQGHIQSQLLFQRDTVSKADVPSGRVRRSRIVDDDSFDALNKNLVRVKNGSFKSGLH